MKWDEETETFVLDTGRTLDANCGFIGIGAGGHFSNIVSAGYDDMLTVVIDGQPCWPVNPMTMKCTPLTPDEKREIAAFMIERWRVWGCL